ncbi:MAG: DUF4041 domain-containing protein [Cyanobacteria bacterium P01_H01_bin.21]
MDTFLFITVLWMGFSIWQYRQEKNKLKERLKKYSSLISQEEYREDLDNAISEKEMQLEDLEDIKESLEESIKKLRVKFTEIDDRLYVKSLDFYEPQYAFISSQDYIFRLRQIREEIKELKERGRDYICYQDLFIDRRDDGKKTIKISSNITQLMKIAFETECKYVIKNVKFSNLDKSERKIKRLFNRINKQAGRIDFEISEELLELKLRELILHYELYEKQHEEKERQKIQAEDERKMKNAEKAKRKLEEAEEREKRYTERLEAALNRQNSIAIREQQKLEQEVLELRKLVEEAHTETEKAQDSYRKAMTKKGYIYILSNIGVLGENIYRICMTQSTPPESYIDRMNPMVPFPFDTHIKLFSQDSLSTLRQLHQRFSSQRLNLVNDRRDFFRVSFDEIIQAIEEIENDTGFVAVEGEPVQIPEAHEYIKSRALARQHSTSDKSEY